MWRLSNVNDIKKAAYFSIAFDESTDVSHISQLTVIARNVVDGALQEENLTVLPLKGTTKGEDLFNSFISYAKEKNLPMDRLVSVCTDGAPCMIGKKSGLVALICDHLKRPILSYHCILHQEALCAQILDKELGDVMDVVTSVVKFIVARSLNHRQFKALLMNVKTATLDCFCIATYVGCQKEVCSKDLQIV